MGWIRQGKISGECDKKEANTIQHHIYMYIECVTQSLCVCVSVCPAISIAFKINTYYNTKIAPLAIIIVQPCAQCT